MINVLSSSEIKELRALRFRKARAETGRFLAEGIRVVEDLLESSLRLRWVACASSLEDTDRGRRLRTRLDDRDIPLRLLSDRDFAAHAATEQPQGVLAVAEIPTGVLRVDEAKSPTLILVLDAIQDPGNFGTMIRSAEALGADAVIVLPGSVDPWNPKSVRSAAGSSFRLPILQMFLDDLQKELAAQNYEFLGADMSGAPVTGGRRGRIALAVGNEGSGLTPDVRAAVDGFVSVPIRGRADSLNVAAAAAILMHELLK